MDNNTNPVVIAGGGIAGLSAAYYIRKSGYSGPLTLIESSNEIGGKIATTRLTLDDSAEFIIDGGPESMITRKPEAGK